MAKLENGIELGSIIFKTDQPYEHNPISLLSTGYYDELKALGVVSQSVLDATIIALLEPEQASKALELPLYWEDQSGIIWTLKEAREGSVVNEFIAYAVQLAGDESFRPYIENGIYDLGKMALGAAFISLPKMLNKRLQKRVQENNVQELQISQYPNVVDFRVHPKLSERWKKTEH